MRSFEALTLRCQLALMCRFQCRHGSRVGLSLAGQLLLVPERRFVSLRLCLRLVPAQHIGTRGRLRQLRLQQSELRLVRLVRLNLRLVRLLQLVVILHQLAVLGLQRSSVLQLGLGLRQPLGTVAQLAPPAHQL